MRVVDVSDVKDFQALCVSFRHELDKRFPDPDIIVGVATGGAWVVDEMDYEPSKIIILKRQRMSTKMKSRVGLGRILSVSPRLFNDFLRILEAAFREVLFNFRGRLVEKGKVVLISGKEGMSKECRSILIIDDAVDSGATFVDVVDFLRKAFPDAIIFSAALTQTFNNPIYKADFVFYKRSLIRSPWAMDAKR